MGAVEDARMELERYRRDHAADLDAGGQDALDEDERLENRLVRAELRR
ncbi:MAG: hypothetical protein M3N43_01735 [Actinomycetota bacterium]|nr:hypothetical protein [Actinomycetota bacterium]